jgi:hypothetical protein
VRITVGEGTGAQLIREGCGAGHGIDTDLGQAHESALKEAETDAMKRALMTFGNPFGLALYDKQQREVTRPEACIRPAAAAARLATQQVVASTPSVAVTADERSLAPLDPATIQQLLATIRSLPRPVLEGFSTAFRKRFQVPVEVPFIADRICQQQHHDWIETFLVQHLPVAA